MKLQLHLQKALLNPYSLPSRQQFIKWINCALETAQTSEHPETIEITIRFSEEEESARLNEQYRHKSGPTNILSFSADNSPNATSCYLGDLLVCVPLVFKEAKEQGKMPIAHFAHLTVHGILHLLDYDHISESDAMLMEALEIDILKQLGHENPY